jgi:Fe-S cluster assembly protein SufD
LSTVTEITGLGSYLEAFSKLQQRTSRQPEWLRSLRQKAFGLFCNAGFPTLKDEAWRFTNVTALSREQFSLPEAGGFRLTNEDLQPFVLPGAACRLVFVNGRFVSGLSDRRSLPSGVEACSLAAEIDCNVATLEAHLGHYLNIQNDPFCSLNTAFLDDGAYVHIARGTVLEAPIHLLFVSTETDIPWMVHPRNLLIAERDAQVDIVEEHISLGNEIFFSNTATELVAAENAVVAHHMIECENRKTFHVSTLRIQQERNANVSSHSVLTGGALVRNNVHPVLAGEGGECLINGLFIGDDHQHLDNYMLVEHVSPRCGSHQFYNGILSASAHGVFHGRIIVHKDAQKTDAKQTNRNLLLSDDAQIDTKPQLEIYADDVKCTHGATIGQIDENALYYLRSRGIDESSARELLLFAFAGECLARIRSGPARKHIERIVHQSLPEGTPSDGGGLGAERHWEEVG